MKRMIKTFGAGAIALLVALTLAACGKAAASGTAGATASNSGPTSAAVATPSTASAASTDSSAGPAPGGASAAASSATATSTAKLNLNTATEQQLMATIPGFSSRWVREFMEYRPYVSIQQFRKELEKYVSADQVTTWEQYVYVPVDVNTSDAATLQQIPGVNATIVEQLIAARPYQSTDAFLAKLASSVSSDQLTAAKAYLVTQ